jgi:hypothetical protein
MPEAFVVAEALETEPPPELTVKVTVTPDTGLLLASRTSTLGAVATAVPTVADWLLPALMAICVGTGRKMLNPAAVAA